MKLKFDTYTIIARIFPAVISLVPFLILLYYLLMLNEFSDLFKFLSNFKFIEYISISLVILYFYSQIIRVTSKYYENKYFLHKRGFPTTYLMLYSNSIFSNQYKDNFRNKIQQTFNIILPTQKDEDENITATIKRLNEVSKSMILKVGNGSLVKKHNIWYGFFRNLIGGLIYSSIFCVFNIIYGFYVINNFLLIIMSIILLVVYILLFIFKKRILIQNAEAYAKQLIAEFLINNA